MPAAELPAIRNNWTRLAMRGIRSFPDDARALVLDAISKSTQTAISKAKPNDWLPAEYAVEVCEALDRGLGVDGCVEFWRAIVFDSYAGGLLEELIRDNSDLLELAPKAWELSARNAGHIVVVPDGVGLRLEARGLPTMMQESLGIQAMFAGAVRAILAFSKIDATISFEGDAGDGAIGFVLQFGPTPRP